MTEKPYTAEALSTSPLPGRWSRFRAHFKERSRFYISAYLLMLPTLIGMIIFSYYPKFAVIKYSFYRWDGEMIRDFIGWKNFIDITNDPLFWHTFKLTGILLGANIVKMWPCIFAAIVLHRLRNAKAQYIYRVLFVIPMVIPHLVTLLIWKSFYDPNVGILNTFLRSTGLMQLLDRLDTVLPAFAQICIPLRVYTVDRVWGNVWVLAVFGVMLMTAARGFQNIKKKWVWWTILLLVFYGTLHGNVIHGTPLVIIVFAAGIIFAKIPFTGASVLQWIGGSCLGIAVFFILFTMIWTEPTYAFITGSPAWLGHSKLIIPAMIFWGFPWVGTIGVLIYLAGLQNISQDVYEAAELDGVGPIGKLFFIELPLILTQVRINLIFMTIGTLMMYQNFLLLLGPEGGPDNVGMVPGLYMYQKAFIEGRFGYACALGMVMFILILFLTIIYQKYVKVEK